jgi:hypothetical protein
MSSIQEHVAERAVHLARRRQYPVMVPTREHTPRAARDSIHGTREPHADRLHPAPERVAILRLDDQMRMVAEQRIVHKAKIAAIAADREGTLELPHDSDVA